jgi:predicted nucleic acid-binding Zn ribbon protein
MTNCPNCGQLVAGEPEFFGRKNCCSERCRAQYDKTHPIAKNAHLGCATIFWVIFLGVMSWVIYDKFFVKY